MTATMKTLYFDIDGTIILREGKGPKRCLADGKLEAAIRNAQFRRLVCVGNFAKIAGLLKGGGIEYDELAALLSICCGTFTDERWFRSVTTLVAEPEHRTQHINYSDDWWYVDDLAAEYLRAANQEDVLKLHQGSRICIPDPMGNGQDVIDWLKQAV